MTRTRVLLGAVVVMALLAAVIWFLRPDPRIRRIGAQAATPTQVRLWGEVDDLPAGLERLAIPVNPVSRSPGAQGVSRPLAPQPITMAGVQNGLQLLAASERGRWSYFGPATVLATSTVRIDLDLGGGRTMSVASRVAGQPISVAMGDTVAVAVESRPGDVERRQIVGLQTADGTTILTVVEGGFTPVEINLTLGTTTFTARQVGVPAKGTMPVQVVVGPVTETLMPGPPTPVNTWTVRLVASIALPLNTGRDASPYGVDLTAWRVPTP